MRILVTGANGFLGRSLLELGGDVELIGCGRGAQPASAGPYYQADMADAAAAARVLQAVRPDWVINTAAMTDVDGCETDRAQARRANVDLVANLVTAARQVDSGVLQLSTDYVFDGASGPYSETDTANPLSHYGQLKLESERLVLAGDVRGIVVRTLWLYGYLPHAHPNFITWTLDALYRGTPIRVFADQWGNPTCVSDLAAVLLALCGSGASGLFHMGGATFLTRFQLVLELARTFNLDAGHVEPVSTQRVGLKAERPLRSGLRTDRLQAHLGHVPMDFAAGLEDMRSREAFRRDFAHIAAGG